MAVLRLLGAAADRRSTYGNSVTNRISRTLFWPLVNLYDSYYHANCLLRSRSSLFDPLLVLRIYYFAIFYNVPPLEFVIYGFHLRDRRKLVHLYLYSTDFLALPSVNGLSGAKDEDVGNKFCFANICSEFGLPHVPTIAAFEAGRQITPPTRVRPKILFSKALRGQNSLGAEVWTLNGRHYRSSRGKLFDWEQLLGHLRAHDCILQPFVRNHDRVASITNGKTACLRIVTAGDGQSVSHVVGALLVVPVAGLVSSTGGIVCGVNLQTGTVIGTVNLSTGETPAYHPDTGYRLRGFVLPFWRQSVELVQKAHSRAFSSFFSLGWDVALTGRGPVILETNSNWGAMHHQLFSGPIGSTSFSPVLEERLKLCV